MREYLREYLVCPACRGELEWEVAERSPTKSEDIIEAAATCRVCRAVYYVKRGVGAFLTPDLHRDDLWERVESHLSAYLRRNPAVEAALLESPLTDLEPADMFVRGLVLSDRGDFQGAEAAFAGSAAIYTPEYRAAQDSQIAYLVDRVSRTSGPVVDLASGKGALVRPLVENYPGRPLVVTDFSPTVLIPDKAFFDHLGIGEHLDYLAFDVRRMPFRDASVPAMTTHVGLQNISDAHTAIREIARVLGGTMLASGVFYPPDDADTDALLESQGLSGTYHRESFARICAENGLRVSVENSTWVRTLPTPISLLTGIQIDGLPLKEMTVEWCTVVLNAPLCSGATRRCRGAAPQS